MILIFTYILEATSMKYLLLPKCCYGLKNLHGTELKLDLFIHEKMYTHTHMSQWECKLASKPQINPLWGIEDQW